MGGVSLLEWDKQDLHLISKANIWKIVLYRRALKQFLFEEMRRIYLLQEIVKYGASLNFVVFALRFA
jgi:hypothetical protein